MVVVGCNTLVTVLAVLGPQRHFNVADAAKFLLDEQNHVVLVSMRVRINLDFMLV